MSRMNGKCNHARGGYGKFVAEVVCDLCGLATRPGHVPMGLCHHVLSPISEQIFPAQSRQSDPVGCKHN